MNEINSRSSPRATLAAIGVHVRNSHTWKAADFFERVSDLAQPKRLYIA